MNEVILVKEQYGDLTICYSFKKDGNMSKKFGDNADFNRQKFIRNQGLDLKRFLFMQPNNEDQVVELKEQIVNCEDLYYKMIETDAIICKVPNVYLYLNFADCIPFILYDKKQHIFAFAHLGWKSTFLDLHKKLFHIFIEQYHSKIEDLWVYMGPCIKKESYLLFNPIQKTSPAWDEFVVPMENNLYGIDLSGYVRDFFLKKNLLNSQIVINPIDTGKDQNIFSHYRATHHLEEENGRFFFCVGREEA